MNKELMENDKSLQLEDVYIGTEYETTTLYFKEKNITR